MTEENIPSVSFRKPKHSLQDARLASIMTELFRKCVKFELLSMVRV